MTNELTIVMYHYVRDIEFSRYNRIRGLEIASFRRQLDFLVTNYNIISCEKLLECALDKAELPPKSLLLTFDDGYIDHYLNVFPILNEYNLSGFFSMPGKIIAENKLLDVNKLHFILASCELENLMKDVFDRLNYYRQNSYKILTNSELYSKLAISNRFDNEKVIFVKRLLQKELDQEIRSQILDELFKKYIQIDEKSFAKELYMNETQIKLMKREGMHFGIHGYDHNWLESLCKEDLYYDISKALQTFVDLNVVNKDEWIMCYPYGSWNENTISICKTLGCKLGFTTEARKANILSDNVSILPRFDTNDFPK